MATLRVRYEAEPLDQLSRDRLAGHVGHQIDLSSRGIVALFIAIDHADGARASRKITPV